jgi:2-desacetyl-2-hydroxyethyl bacteriochlorophyllide A dehydrogenase
VRAFVITGPGEAAVQDVPEPEARPGEVVIDVARAGLCGTDAEFFTGTMPYLHDGQARYPIRIGHEWCGHVSAVGPDVVRSWLGASVTGDTMLGCGTCARCRSGRHHVCADRYEVGVRGGWHGALAERLRMPAIALKRLPDDLPPEAGALVEPGGAALRAVCAAQPSPGDVLCVWGAGTLGLLALQFALARGAVADVVDPRPASRALALELGARSSFPPGEAPDRGYDAVIDASPGRDVPARCVEQVEPTGRVVLVGLSPEPSLLDTRRAVLRDVTVVGVLSGSAALDRVIELMGTGAIRTASLVAATVALGDVADVLGGNLGQSPTGAPKVLVDPSR